MLVFHLGLVYGLQVCAFNSLLPAQALVLCASLTLGHAPWVWLFMFCPSTSCSLLPISVLCPISLSSVPVSLILVSMTPEFMNCVHRKWHTDWNAFCRLGPVWSPEPAFSFIIVCWWWMLLIVNAAFLKLINQLIFLPSLRLQTCTKSTGKWMNGWMMYLIFNLSMNRTHFFPFSHIYLGSFPPPLCW